jgi:hypothetical protein
MLLEINRDGPYIKPCLHSSGKRKAPGCEKTSPKICPPPVVFVRRKRVTFDTDLEVVEYENELTEDDKELLWYDENDETENFRIVRAESSDSEERVDNICYNHTRGVLMNYESYKTMDNGSDILRNVSTKSSLQARKNARKQAEHLSKAVHTWSQPQDDFILGFGFDSRIADYYIETMMDTLVERNWLCGALLSVTE